MAQSTSGRKWFGDAPGEQGRLLRLERLAAIATRLTAIIGIVVALVQLTSFVRSATSTLDAVKLQALDKVVGLLQIDAQIQKNQLEYLATSAATTQLKMLDEALKQDIPGQQFYWSDAASSFSEIADHYERLGAILRLGYLEFDIIFQIVPFPDRFWKATSELRGKIRENWFGPKQALPDFQENFAWLCRRYEQERARLNFESAKNMKCEYDRNARTGWSRFLPWRW
jgi:hypothetical protein